MFLCGDTCQTGLESVVDSTPSGAEWELDGFVDTEFSSAASRYFYRENEGPEDKDCIGSGGLGTVKE